MKPDNSYHSLKTIFSHNDIKNNLIYLGLDSYNKIEIEDDLFEPLNDFKVLEELTLQSFKFKNNFSLKLNNLKNLELIYCENINFENCCLYLNKLRLVDYNIITPPKSQLQFPNLVSCDLDYNSKMNYNILIDFKSLKNLKKFSSPWTYFLNLENDSLIIAKCYFNDINDIIAKKILNKLLKFKCLQNLHLKSFEMNIYEISKIEGHNDSINWKPKWLWRN